MLSSYATENRHLLGAISFGLPLRYGDGKTSSVVLGIMKGNRQHGKPPDPFNLKTIATQRSFKLRNRVLGSIRLLLLSSARANSWPL